MVVPGILLLLAVQLVATSARAQELGELLLESGLNQPLRATIDLLGTDGMDPRQIQLSIAGAADYNRMGLERPALASDIQVTVELFSFGGGVATLTSTQPVQESFFNLVVNARWPNGASQRDYTVLVDMPAIAARQPPPGLSAPLDPPVLPRSNPFAEPAPAAVAAGPAATNPLPVVRRPVRDPELAGQLPPLAPDPDPTRTAALPPVPPDPDPARRTTVQAPSPAPVPATALRNPAPAPGATALRSLAPDPDPAARASQAPAPAGSYTVRAGDSLWQVAELTRPSTDISVPQMMVALQRANPDAFIDGDANRLINGRVLRIPSGQEASQVARSEAASALAVQNQRITIPATARTTNTATRAPGRDELTLLGGGSSAGTAVGGGSLEARVVALESDLLASEEELDRSRLENRELNERLSDLDQQIVLLQQLIAIENERLGLTQGSLAARTTQPTAQPEPVAVPEVQTVATAVTDDSQTGWLGRLQSLLEHNLILVGSGFLGLLVVLAFLVVYRARHEDDFEHDQPFNYRDHDEDDDLDYEALDAAPRHDFDEDERRFMHADGLPPDVPDAATPAAATATATAAPRPAIPTPAAPAPAAAEPATATAPAPAAPAASAAAEPLTPWSAASSSSGYFNLKVAPFWRRAAEEPPPADPLPEADDDADHGLESLLRSIGDDPVTAASAAAAPTPPTSAAMEDLRQQLQDPPSPLSADDVVNLDPSVLEADSEPAQVTPVDELGSKLDLAVAFQAMGDLEVALEALDDVLARGTPEQVAEARRLQAQWRPAQGV